VVRVFRRARLGSEELAAAAMRSLRTRKVRNSDEAALLILALCTPSVQSADPFGAEEPAKVSAEDRTLVDECVRFLVADQVEPTFDADRGGKGWGVTYRGWPKVPDTSLAVIALESAAAHGVEVPRSAYAQALELLIRWQAQDGAPVVLRMNEVRGTERLEWSENARSRGWGHSRGLEETGRQTAGAALSVVACRDVLFRTKKVAEASNRELQTGAADALRDALAWLQENFDVRTDPSPRGREDSHTWHYEWLCALAQLGLRAHMRFIGDHDWYAEGAEYLMKSQRPDGSWASGARAENFQALLFLLRTSPGPSRVVVTRGEK
jgi:hypothetical protein